MLYLFLKIKTNFYYRLFSSNLLKNVVNIHTFLMKFSDMKTLIDFKTAQCIIQNV